VEEEKMILGWVNFIKNQLILVEANRSYVNQTIHKEVSNGYKFTEEWGFKKYGFQRRVGCCSGDIPPSFKVCSLTACCNPYW
jgi:hypothetical protein